MADWRLKTDQIRCFGVTLWCRQTWPWEIPYEWTLKWENHLLTDEVLVLSIARSIVRFVCRKVRQIMTKFMDLHSILTGVGKCSILGILDITL